VLSTIASEAIDMDLSSCIFLNAGMVILPGLQRKTIIRKTG
jgi:hypothetical protein